MLNATPDLMELQAKALAGDTRAAAQFRVAKWNASVPVGTEVFYVKSQAEGKCRLKTVGAAFVMGEDQPVVDLVGIGPVALDKTEPTFD